MVCPSQLDPDVSGMKTLLGPKPWPPCGHEKTPLGGVEFFVF
jgi:hypothetical protein